VVVLSLCHVASTSAAATGPQAVDPFVQNQRLGRGVNIIGYDPLWRSRDQARFKTGYFRMLKDAGFTNVRINLHPFRRMEQGNDYALPASWWETLDWATSNALQSGLMVILDLHEFGAMGTDPEVNKPRFLAFWRQVSERLRAAPDRVLFEILNEPSRKLSAAMWNEYLAKALAIIRKTNPTRTVIIGPAGYNSIGQLRELKLPEDDRNIIVTVHYYSPMDSRVRYLAFVVGAMERRGWSWAYWQFDSDFLLYDVRNEKWIEPVRDALVGRASSGSRAGDRGTGGAAAR